MGAAFDLGWGWAASNVRTVPYLNRFKKKWRIAETDWKPAELEEHYNDLPVFEKHVTGFFTQIMQDTTNLNNFGKVHGQIATFQQQTPPT